MQLNSSLLEKAVEQIQTLPGIGRKTAIRLALSLIKREPEEVKNFARSMEELRDNIQYCQVCHNISDEKTCHICANKSRDHSTICVVQDIRDVMALEGTGSYRGLYHVLGGLISPLEGIGPHDLTIDLLLDRIAQENPSEIILALSTTMEGETTTFLLVKKLREFSVKISTIARGVAFGNDLEYADDITLGKSIANRTPYDGMTI